MGCFKISSSDITNKPFIQQIAGYGKPIILSTGASDIWEVQKLEPGLMKLIQLYQYV